MKALKEWLNVSSLSVTSSLSYLLLLHFRARLSVVKSVSLVMPGRCQILMHTSLSPAIGLRRKPPGSGLNGRHFSALLRVLDEHYSQWSLTGPSIIPGLQSAGHRSQGTHIHINDNAPECIIPFFRSATSHVTMQRTMTP